ncbi:MAG: 16S rRNA (cytidine(1402)-2'-O)-methyltransferase [Firmicutes bacterium]|nr:16S rRNA (cytidine(1402)-2'-O)-methyltransferase [Candidatus Colimorpha enterica]
MTEERNKTEKGALYLVATPIGNLDDITYRAVKVLSECDFVAAEDTRVTAKLLSHLEISKPVVIYQKFNLKEAGGKIAERLKNGETCALVTDAGTPGISDPGQDIAKLCILSGIKVIPVPGACALINALIGSGMNTDRFLFEGFIGSKKSEAKKRLEAISAETATVILYEAPHRLVQTLEAINEVFGGDRELVLCRELTKLNEEFIRTTAAEALALYSENEPRGEYVIVIEGASSEGDEFWTNLSIEQHVSYYVEKMNLSKMDAIKQTAKDRRVPKKEIYRSILDSEENGGGIS